MPEFLGLSTLEVLKTLIDAGLDTLPGGGAEILSERYRLKMSPDKVTSEEWLNIHRQAHNLGLKPMPRCYMAPLKP